MLTAVENEIDDMIDEDFGLNTVLAPILPEINRAILAEGECFLQYKKMDGTLRTTTGTIRTDLIPKELRPQATRERTFGLISYYDTASQGWRSFFSERLERIFLIP